MGDLKGQLSSYATALWRRRWLILLTTWVVALLGWTVVWLLPDRYESRARIYVDTDSLIQIAMGQMVVSPNIAQQIEFMQRTLTSRPNLEKVARIADLDLKANTPKELENVILDLEEDITVVAETKNLFDISYVGTDPQVARNVVQALVTIFVESNLGASRTDMDNTRRVIDDQIAQYEAKLQAAERRLADFKRENIELLPSTGSYVNAVEQARQLVRELQASLDDALSRKSTLETQLQTIPPTIEVNAGTVASAPSPVRQQITELERRLAELQLVYTEKHPDVIATRRAIQDLRRQPGAGTAGGTSQMTSSIPNVVYEQVKLDLVQTESEISRLQRRLEAAEETLLQREERAKAVPAVEAQFADMNRDYVVLKSQYESLLARREQVRLSGDIESRGDQVQFRVVEPPVLPVQPAAPNRPLFMAIVFVAAIGVGVAGALVLGQMDDSFRSVHDLRQAFVLPVIGGVSLAMTGPVRRRQVVSATALVISSLALVVLFGALMYVQITTTMTPSMIR